jgi:hypothetical protein
MVKSGSINGIPFGYQKKAVHPTVRIAKAETPGKMGTSIDQMGVGGSDITLDVIAQSVENRDALIAAFMTQGRGILKPGTPDNDWHFSGIGGDYSTDFTLSQYDPRVAYPLSFLFQTDMPYLLSDKITTIGKQIISAGQEWFSADTIAFNMIRNESFESAITGSYTTFDNWIIGQSPVVTPEHFQANVSKFGTKSLKIVNSRRLSIFGDIYQPLQFEAGVEYTMGFYGYIENPTGSEIVLELREGSNSLCSVTGRDVSDFTLFKMKYTFSAIPVNATLHIYGKNDALETTNHYVDGVFCMKSSDYPENLIGTFITSGDYGGTVDPTPDIQIDSLVYGNPMGSIIDEHLYTQVPTTLIVSDLNPHTKVFPPPQTVTSNATASYTFQVYSHGVYTNTNNVSISNGTVWTPYNIPAINGTAIIIRDITCDVYCRGESDINYKIDSDYIDIAYINESQTPNTFHLVNPGQYQRVSATISVEISSSSTSDFDNLDIEWDRVPNPVLLKTITIPAGSDGAECVINTINFTAVTSNSGVPSTIYVWIQHGTDDAFVVGNRSTNSTSGTAFSFTNLRSPGHAGYTSVVRFYGLQDEAGYTVSVKNCSVVYSVEAYSNYGPALCTLSIPSEAQAHTLYQVDFKGSTSDSGNPAQFLATIQHGSGSEESIDTWTTMSTNLYTNTFSGLTKTGTAATTSILRIYGRLIGGTGGTVTVDDVYGYYGRVSDYTLVTTLLIPARNGATNTITEIGFSGKTTSSSNPAKFYASIQHGNGTVTDLGEWQTSSTSDLVKHTYTNINSVGPTNTNATIRFFAKLSNGALAELSMEDCYVYYVAGSALPPGSPTNVYVYNKDDPFTMCNICTSLLKGSSVRVNADGTGFFRYYDNFLTNLYQDVATTKTNLSWSVGQLTIGANGTLGYTFDIRYPIDGIPFLIMNVISGNPQIGIGVNEAGSTGVIYQIDENLVTVPQGAHLWKLYNLANCNLTEATNISVTISPRSGQTCVIGSIFLWCSTFTVSAELPKITLNNINTYKIDMSESAPCMVSLLIHDYKWGI